MRRHQLGGRHGKLVRRSDREEVEADVESRGNGGDEVGAVDAEGVLIDVGVAVAVE